jgi:hypothetical protein
MRVEDAQLEAVVEMIARRAEAASLTGDEVTLDSLEMMALDLFDARQEIAKLTRLAEAWRAEVRMRIPEVNIEGDTTE